MALKTDEAKACLRAAYKSGEILKLVDVASRVHCSLRIAHDARRQLVESGELPASALPRLGRRRPRVPGTGGSEIAQQSHADLVRAVLSGEGTALSTDQQRAMLSQLIIHSPDHNVKVAAQNALTRLDAQAGASIGVGPGIPLTEDDRVGRLVRLFHACGWITVRRAVKEAFDKDLGDKVQVDGAET